MKFKISIKTMLLLATAFIVQTAHGNELTVDFISKTNSIARIPAVQIDWILRSAQSSPQSAAVQNAVANIVETSFGNFESLDNRGRYKLLKTYNQLLTSPLLRDEQKAYLRDTIIPRVTPLVQPLDPQQVSAADLETRQLLSNLAPSLAQQGASTTAPAATTPAAPVVQAAVQNANQLPAAVQTVAPVATTALAAAPVAQAVQAAVENTNQLPVAVQTVAPVATTALTAMPVAQAIQTAAQNTNQLPAAVQTITPVATNTLAAAPVAQAVQAAVQVAAPIATTALTAMPLANSAIQASVASTSTLPVAIQPIASTATTLNPAAILAITQNTQLGVAAKAAALMNLINTTSTQAPADATAAAAVAQAIQDLYNAQTPNDARSISDLLQAILQKPVLTPDQRNYVSTTLVPAIAQKIAIATSTGTATTTQLTQAIAPAITQTVSSTGMPGATLAAGTQVVQNAGMPSALSVATQQPANNNFAQLEAPSKFAANALSLEQSNISAANATAALAPVQASQSDLEGSIKALYTQIQAATGNTYDAAAQGAFGASLVETFNNVVEIQSYMSQLLTSAEDTPLLNEAQQKYVREVMIPNLDQVSSATPTKTLDHAVANDKAKAGKPAKGGKKAKKPGVAGATAKKGKKSKKAKKADASLDTAHSAEASSHSADTSSHGAEAHKEAGHHKEAAGEHDATKTAHAAKKAGKKGKKKLKKAAPAAAHNGSEDHAAGA